MVQPSDTYSVFVFFSCILYYVACEFVICLIKYLLTYLLIPRDALSLCISSREVERFQWNLAQMFIMWTEIAEKAFKVRGQRSKVKIIARWNALYGRRIYIDLCPSVRPFVHPWTLFTWRGISVLSGRMWMKRGIYSSCEWTLLKRFQGQRSKVKVTARSNALCGGGMRFDGVAFRVTCFCIALHCIIMFCLLFAVSLLFLMPSRIKIKI